PLLRTTKLSVMSRARAGSTGPGAVDSETSAGHSRNRSCCVAARAALGLTVRLKERVTTTLRSGRTLAITNRGPTAKSGCGFEARKIWADAADGDAAASART